MLLATCPLCTSFRIMKLVTPRGRVFCTACGAIWTIENGVQTNIRQSRINPRHPSIAARRHP